MRRHAKPAKAKVEAKLPIARKSPKNDRATVRDLENRLVEALGQLQTRDRELGEALDQQTATGEILRVISSSPTELAPVFEAIVRSAAQLCEATFAVLHRFDGQVVTFEAHYGMSQREVEASLRRFPRPPDRETAVSRAILDRRTTHIHDIQRDPEYRVMAGQMTFRTVLAVPLLRDGVPVGAIGLWRREVQPFSEKQIKLVETFAAQAVIAVENVRLFTELQASNSELRVALEQQMATSEILGVISRSPSDVAPVFATIARNAMHLLGGATGGVFLVTGDRVHFGAAATRETIGPIGGLTFPMSLSEFSRHRPVLAQVLETRAPASVADMETDPRTTTEARQFARAVGFRSNAIVPMLRDDELIGLIVVARAEPRATTDDEMALLKTFSDQAVIAIENVRLFKELEARNRELTTALDTQTATSDILRVISRSQTDVQPVFDTIVRNAVRLCDAIYGLVYRSDGEHVYLAAHHNFAPQQLGEWQQTFPRPINDSGASVHVIRTGVVLRVADVEIQRDSPISETGRALLRSQNARSVLIVPMFRQTEVIGSITLTHRDVGAFTDAHVELLKTFADQAVIAIENVRLFTELQDKNRAVTEAHAQATEALERQTATSEILRAISSSPTDAQPVFEGIARSGVRVCRALGCAVFVIENGIIRVAATHGVRKERIERFRTQFPAPVSAEPEFIRVIRDGLFHLADIENNPETTAEQLEFARLAGYRTRLMVPMRRGDDVLGVIAVTREEASPFSDQQVELLKTFADQAVIAIENVRLFKELEARNQDLTDALARQTATSDILRVISSSPTDVQPVFDTIVESAVTLCDGLFGGLVRFDGELIHQVATHNYTPEALDALRRAFPARPSRTLGVGRAILERDVVHLPDVELDPEYQVQNLAGAIGFRSGIFVPMLRDDAPIGAILVARAEPGPFPDNQIALLKTFADQAVIAIENVRLFTELQTRNREIADKSRQLEVASQHKSEFLANMSHELRTPLNAIIGFSEVLSERMFGELNEKQEEYLKDIYASGTHLLSLINDILDLSKIEAGRMELELTDFDLPTAIDNALTLVRERAARRGIALEKSVDERLGQMRADERKLRQVVLNLLSNAIKFTPEGGRIEVGAVPKDGFVEVSVSDTGVGIAPADQEAVFEEFRQVGTADKKVEGTGLGLALSRKFVELHGGKIWITSRVGVGSTFTFTIPVRRDG